jgi:hypothetical protein
MPPLVVESPPNPRLDVVLRQTGRAWVLIATNLDRTPQRVIARLPAEVPSALWVSLLDGDAMSMLSLPGGPRWTVDLAPGEARAYVIDKVGSDRGQTPVRPRSDPYFKISSAVTTFTGPRFAFRIGCSIFDRSPTTTTAKRSVRM